MTPRATRPWLNYLLGVACVGAIVAAFFVVGPASGSQATVTRTAVAAQGVVQSTVSGSGNLQAASQLDLGFKTSGTVTNIYVTQGQHVTEGQLLATLNPESAEVALEQARASLQSALANLAQEEESDGETSTGQSSGLRHECSRRDHGLRRERLYRKRGLRRERPHPDDNRASHHFPAEDHNNQKTRSEKSRNEK
jgi:multidrug efflux pump subunit AcrA (membrane-fusion protein)